MSFSLYLLLSETLALLFVLLAVFGLISNVSNLCRRDQKIMIFIAAERNQGLTMPLEFHQRPG